MARSVRKQQPPTGDVQKAYRSEEGGQAPALTPVEHFGKSLRLIATESQLQIQMSPANPRMHLI
jgi:hypothetical protein